MLEKFYNSDHIDEAVKVSYKGTLKYSTETVKNKTKVTQATIEGTWVNSFEGSKGTFTAVLD